MGQKYHCVSAKQYKNWRMGWRLVTAALFCVFLLACSSVRLMAAEEVPWETAIKEGGFSATLYDNDSGFLASGANAVVQSPDGFIWIGGSNGLTRYDGRQFYHFDASSGITGVGCLYVDSEQRLWVGTNDKGALLYGEGNFRMYGRDEGLSSGSVKDIIEDDNGNIILATTQGLAYIDRFGELHLIEDSWISSQYIRQMDRDTEGTIYGVTLGGELFTLNHLTVGRIFSRDCFGNRKITSICTTGTPGVVYLGTDGNKVLWINLNGDLGKYRAIDTKQYNINRICRISDQCVWVCTDAGMGYIDGNRQYVEVKNLPMDNSVNDMVMDWEGNLWFTSARQGLMKISKSRFCNISHIAGLKPVVVNTTCMYDNYLYIGTDKGLIILDENGQSIANDLTEQLTNVRIRCIRADSGQSLWICTYGALGLIRYEKNGMYRSYNEENGLNSNGVRVVLELANGDIAVATSGGVNLIRDSKIVESYGIDEGITNTEILSLCEGEDGVLYAGSDGAGIFVMDGGKIDNINQEDGLLSDVITRMKWDGSHNCFWILTGNSIAYMKNGEVKTIRSFPYSNNYDIFFSDGGDAWILGGNGIYQVDADLLAADEVEEYRFYDTSLGLPCNITSNSRSYIDKDGNLYLSGSAYVSKVNINEEEPSMDGIHLNVPFVSMDNEIVYVPENRQITVQSDCKRVTIYAYAMSYTLTKPRLSYYLEGFETQVSEMDQESAAPVSYTNLSGGKYVFHFWITDNGTSERLNEVTLTIIKEKSLTERGWFIALLVLLAVLLLAGAVYLYVRHRTAALVKKQEENRIFVSQMIRAFSKAIDSKDKYTNGHSSRVASYTKMMAKRLGYEGEQLENIYNIALLHDVGKLAIPDSILNKPGKLSDGEYDIMKKHAQYGYDILKEIESFPNMPLGAGYHHERMDGAGYPKGIVGQEIPYVARIIAVADTFDAMNSTRIYRPQMDMEDIVAELKRVAGSQLDPDIVNVMLQLIEENKIS